MIPTKNQWKNWTLPSKYALIGTLIGILGLAFTLLGYFETKTNPVQALGDNHISTNLVTRSEFLANSISTILPNEYIPTPFKDPYNDVSKEFKYSGYIAFAKVNNVITYSKNRDYRFHPKETIRRKEAAKIISNILCLAQGFKVRSCYSETSNIELKYKDLSDVQAFLPFIKFLIKNNVLSNSGNFYPHSTLTSVQSQELIKAANKANPHGQI